MCDYCEWMFTGEEPDFLETLKEWLAGMGRNHPDWKPYGVYKMWDDIFKERCKCLNLDATVGGDMNMIFSQENSEK